MELKVMELKVIEEKVKKVVAEQFGVAVAELKPETRLAEDLGADSLDNVEMVMALEDEFEIEISDAQEEKIKTVQQAIDFIASVK